MRHLDEEVAVVVGAPDGAGEDAPISFAWRGRSYTVREVLGQWSERRAWWHGLLEEQVGAPVAAAALEERVWRVAASPGRSCWVGVYELSHAQGWRLLRVID